MLAEALLEKHFDLLVRQQLRGQQHEWSGPLLWPLTFGGATAVGKAVSTRGTPRTQYEPVTFGDLRDTYGFNWQP